MASASASGSAERPSSYVDIGANLLDDMYQGVYRGTSKHPADLDVVLERAHRLGNSVEKMIVTAGTLDESRQALSLARQKYPPYKLYSTVGVHPTRCDVFGDSDDSAQAHAESLLQVALDGKRDGTVVALGELGLDHARTQFCSKEQQRRGLLAQLEGVAQQVELPLFLHNRDTGTDLYDILKEHLPPRGGVVHSFDDSWELAQKFLSLDNLYIGINGCSLKTPENLQVVKELPLERLLLETDCPWCEIRPSHAGSKFVQTKFETRKDKQYSPEHCVKNRSEPCHIVQVAEVVAGVKGISVNEVAQRTTENAHHLFGMVDER